MASSTTVLVTLVVTLCWAAEDKSHDVWLTRIEEPFVNEKWIGDHEHKLNKVDRKRKSLDVNFTLLQEINDNNLECQVKVFQKNGGKFVKAPFDLPKTPCCILIKNKGLVWRCIRDRSNAPEACPIAPAYYHMKEFDPDLCEYPKNLPPNAAEDYKIEFIGTSGAEQVFKHVGYGVMKKRMQLI